MSHTSRCPACQTLTRHTTEFRRLQATNLLLFAYALGAATQPLLHRAYLLVR
jgi:hypothetical protein